IRVPGSSQQLLEFLHRRHGDQHLVVGNQADRIAALDVTNVDVRQVARSQVQVLINFIGHDEHVGQVQAAQLVQQTLGLRRIDAKLFNHDQTIGASQLGEDGTHGSAIHLLVELLGVILGLGREGHATAAPQRAADGTGAGTTGTLLTERLGTATGHFGTALLSAGTLAAAGHVGHNCLVYQGLVEFTAEDTIGNLDRLSAIYIQLHLSISPYALTAGRTITSPPVAPGTAPLTSSRLRSASTRTTSRDCTVTRSAPR